MRRGFVGGPDGRATQHDDNGSISSGGEDEPEPLSFGKTHFGTDLLAGSYLMLFSALIFYAIMVKRICLFFSLSVSTLIVIHVFVFLR